HDLLALLDQEQRGTPRRARPQSGEPRQQLDQALDFGSGDGGGHGTTKMRFAQLGKLSLPGSKRKGRVARLRQNNFIPGGSGSPPVTACIFSCSRASTLRRASAWAATMRSSTISFSDGFKSESSIRMPFISPLPVSLTLTSPPPEVPSTSA